MNRLTTPFLSMQDKIARKLEVASLSQSYEQLAKWYATPLGREWLTLQTDWVNEEIGMLFGYHLLQMGISTGDHFCQGSRINHCINLVPVLAEKNATLINDTAQASQICDKPSLCAHSDYLPFADESVDVTIMHHTLDFAEDPQQVLREATRITVARGYIILIGFNPHSIRGVFQAGARFFSRKPILNHQRLRFRRVKDWLSLLDFSTIKTQQAAHDLSVNNRAFISRTKKMGKKLDSWNTPLGNMYFILARKDKAGMIPIKPKWQEHTFLGATALPKQTMSTRAKKHYADIYPLRRRPKLKPFTQ